jgi:hypothetical protein
VAFSKAKGKIPIGLLCNTLRSEYRRGNPISPIEAIDLLRESGVLLSEGKNANKCYINLFIPPEIVNALKNYKPDNIPDVKRKRTALGTIILDIIQNSLKQDGYL